MAESHTVVQGEHLSMIAEEYGFFDYSLIWNNASNAQLKALRLNPNVLLPGDVVSIPDKEQGSAACATSKRHTFAIKREKLRLRLVLEDVYEKPIANAPGLLTLDEQQIQVTTDGKGKIDQEIPPRVQNCVFVLNSDQTPFQGDNLSIKIGHLDPVDSLPGQEARLNNLGYRAGNSDDAGAPAFLSAVEEFQCDHGLLVDGVIGPATQAQLKKVHGC